MNKEIKNDIDKLDGMVKIKGKCGYELIGGCSDLRRLKQENKKLKEELAEANQLKDMYHTYYRAKHDDIKGVIFKQKEKLEKIKSIVDFNLIFPINNITKREIGEKIKSIIEGAEDD